MLLANLFLKRFADECRKKVRGFSSDAVKLLQSYEWPGNVRELENKIQRAVIMSDSPVIEPEALGFSLGLPSKEKMLAFSKLTLRDAREMIEREMIVTAIENQKNMAKAAEALGISRPTLYDLVKKHRIEKVVEYGAV